MVKGISKKRSLKKEVQAILEDMNNTDRTSEEYGILVERLEIITKAEANTNGKRSWIWELLGIGVPVALAAWQTKRITKYEEENILNTKALGFIQKVTRGK